MHAETQHHAGEGDVAHLCCPKQGHDHDTKEAFTAPTSRDDGDHWVKQPDACVLQSMLFIQISLLKHDKDHPSGHNIADGKQRLSEAEPDTLRFPRSRQQSPCEKRAISIGIPQVWRAAICNIASSICEDVIVDVSVLQGGIGVLIKAVEEEHHAKGYGGGKDGGRRREETSSDLGRSKEREDVHSIQETGPEGAVQAAGLFSRPRDSSL